MTGSGYTRTPERPTPKSNGACGTVADWRVHNDKPVAVTPYTKVTSTSGGSEKPKMAPWWCDPTRLPQRQFLHGRHYVRGSVSATIAGGGRAKTTLACFEAVSMAVGKNLDTRDKLPAGPLRVLVLNGEEDQTELDRRIAAICQRYGVTEADLGGRLFVISVRDEPMRLASLLSGLAKIEIEVRSRMLDLTTRHRIDVLVVDPLVSFHGLEENNNGHMDLLLKEGFGSIARQSNIAIDVVHHSGKPKPNQAETTVDDARGASAILWAVRSARALNLMTAKEAEQVGITEDERRRHIRISDGKANMAPLGKAKWIRLEQELLPNGDVVACASAWTPPNPFEDVSIAHVDKARELARSGEYRLDPRSPKWFGYALAPLLGLRVVYGENNDKKDMAKLKHIIRTWIKNDVLDIDERVDDSRKKRKFIVPGLAGEEVLDEPCGTDDTRRGDDGLLGGNE
jgi:AAA domain